MELITSFHERPLSLSTITLPYSKYESLLAELTTTTLMVQDLKETIHEVIEYS